MTYKQFKKHLYESGECLGVDKHIFKFFKFIKYKYQKDDYLLIETLGVKVFMKMMSDKGKNDDKVGLRIHNYLNSENIKHEYFDGRKFFIKSKDLYKVFNFSKFTIKE